MPTTDTKKKSTSLRISSTLFAHIEKLAKQENRSLNNFIETTLFNALEYREPNENTKKAIAEFKKDKKNLKRYSSAKELFDDLENE